MQYQAHKGVSTENPENTIPAFLAAIEQGYDLIELDVSPTRDLRFVLLHDTKLNRTGRMADGSELTEEIKISEITYEDALQYDFGIWFSEKFRGTKIPLFDQVLELAEKSGIPVRLWDERSTTVSAIGILNQTDVRGKKRKAVIDAVAAVLILESYMAYRKNHR